MASTDPRWSVPTRVRKSVLCHGHHVGYSTTVGYPNRDLTAFPEGSPYFELVISDLADHHVALMQRFKQHWLIQCGDKYATAAVAGGLSNEQIEELAITALARASEGSFFLAAALRVELERMLGESRSQQERPERG